MRSTITQRGLTTIPAEVRRRLNLGATDRLEWRVDAASIRVVPLSNDPVAAFRGQGKGGATARLLADRRAEGNGV